MRTIITKWLLYALLLLLSVMLSLMPLRIAGIRPLFLPLLAIAVSVREGPVGGGVFGAFAGIAFDALNPFTTALYTVMLMLAGIVSGLVSKLYFRSRLFATLVWAALWLSVCTLLFFFFYIYMPNRAGLSSLLSIAVPELLITLAFAPLYHLLARLIGGTERW